MIKIASSKGVDRPAAKLNDKLVREIRNKRKLGSLYKNLSKEYRISKSQVCCIVNKTSWKHID